MLNTVATILIDGVAPFEFGVICEVFGLDRTDEGVPHFDFRVCGEEPGKPVRSSIAGVQMTPDHPLSALSGADLVAVPACTIRDEYPPAVLEALRRASEEGATLMSVCSGAYVLGAAGLLDGRKCTTHWRYTEDFAQRFPAAQLDPDVLYVDDGNLITSAGTAAGIDASLHIVRREVGSRAANVIARRMVVAPQREGGQQQFIDLPIPECKSDSLQPVLTMMLDALDSEHSVASLAKYAQMSERTFARKFASETGTTPHRWLTTQRVLQARRLLEDSDSSIDTIAERSGFGTSALLRHHFHRIVGIAPNDYRKAFSQRPSVTTN